MSDLFECIPALVNVDDPVTDHVIDLGPAGGEVLVIGIPEEFSHREIQ